MLQQAKTNLYGFAWRENRQMVDCNALAGPTKRLM